MAKIKIYAVRQICGNNRTVDAKLGRQINSPSGEKHYAATVILPRDKQEKRNAALRITKVDTAAKLKTMSDNTTRQQCQKRKYRKTTAKFRNCGKSKKIPRTSNIYSIQRMEAIDTAEGPTTERGTWYRKTKGNFRNQTKREKFSEYAKYVV